VNITRKPEKLSAGFTLVELLVSVLLFSLVVLAIYYFFDKGSWLYLHSEKRSNIQQNARVIMEQMERDFRMIGAGVPKGTNPAGLSWTPDVFLASSYHIGFTSDIDNGTHGLTEDVGEMDNAHIFVGNDSDYFMDLDANNDDTLDTQLAIVVVNNRRSWEDLIAQGLDSNDQALVTTADVQNPSNFPADRSTVQTLERIFYRMVTQAGVEDNDGVCTEPYPFCSIQRQEYHTNDPTETDPETESEGADWITIGTNATFLKFEYYHADGILVDELVNPGGIDQIRITLKCSDRTRTVGQYQYAILESRVLIRNNRL